MYLPSESLFFTDCLILLFCPLVCLGFSLSLSCKDGKCLQSTVVNCHVFITFSQSSLVIVLNYFYYFATDRNETLVAVFGIR